jgi:hypothetical protein
MDFGKFLNNLDENKSFKRVSGRQLREAAGEDAASVAQGAQWYYVPAKEYGGFRHVVVENGANDWAVYYLENIGAGGAKADVSGMAGGGSFIGAQRPVLLRKKLVTFRDLPITSPKEILVMVKTTA